MKCTLLPGLAMGVASVLLAACGSGSGGSVGTGSAGVTISAIAGPNHLQIGASSPETYIYSATVGGSSNTSITWSVSDTSLVTIGATTGVATPSATNTGTVTITAAANADTTKTSSIQVQVVDWILAGPGVTLMNSDGTDSVTLLPLLDGYENCFWTYDHLGFACLNGYMSPIGVPTEFYLFATDGTAGGTKPISTLNLAALGFSGIIGNAHFSLDGSKIVFEGQTTGAGGIGVAGTYEVATNGQSAPVLLAPDISDYDFIVGNPRFTPNGMEILYSQGGTVWIMNADGTNPHQLLAITSQNAELSPDQSMLYYSTGSGIYRANADGSNAVSIAGNAYTFEGLSPNGNSILLVTAAPLGSDGVFTATNLGANLQGLSASGWASW